MGEGLPPQISNKEGRGESPSPGFSLRENPTSPRIRLRPKAGFGGQERGEVNRTRLG